MEKLTPEFLISLTGVVLSVCFSYIPKLNTWFAVQEPQMKLLIMAGIMAAVTAALVGLSCTNTMVFMTCDKQGFVNTILIFFQGMVLNQTAFVATPQTAEVKAAKAQAKIAKQ